MTTTAAARRPLTGRALLTARLAWVAAMLTALLSVAAGVPSRYAQLATVTPAADTVAGQLRPEDAQRLVQSGLRVETYAAYLTVAELLAALTAFGVASLIAWGRSDDWMALYVSLILISAATALPLVPALVAADPRWAWIRLGWQAVFMGTILPLFFLFPDGRWVPRWSRWLAAGWLLYTVSWLVYPPLQPPASFGRGLTASDAIPTLAVVIALPAGVAAQVWRYAHISTVPERQRTKWVVFGFGVLLAGFVIGVATLTYLSVVPAGFGHAAARLVGPSMILLGLNATAMSIALAIIRYRLWDVDLLIRRTLIYAVLSSLLALAYFSSVIVLQNLFGRLTGEAQTPLVTVLSTLTIAALSGPLRRRVQAAIDRRFYRRKYDAARTLAAFGAQARDVVELEQLSEQLIGVVEETMQPASVELWIKPAAKD